MLHHTEASYGPVVDLLNIILPHTITECFCPPKFYVKNYSPVGGGRVLEGEAFGSCLGHEGGIFMNGNSALAKETPGSAHAPSATRGHVEKKAICEEGSSSSSDIKPASPLILDSFLGTVRNKWSLFIRHPVYSMSLQLQTD